MTIDLYATGEDTWMILSLSKENWEKIISLSKTDIIKKIYKEQGYRDINFKQTIEKLNEEYKDCEHINIEYGLWLSDVFKYLPRHLEACVKENAQLYLHDSGFDPNFEWEQKPLFVFDKTYCTVHKGYDDDNDFFESKFAEKGDHFNVETGLCHAIYKAEIMKAENNFYSGKIEGEDFYEDIRGTNQWIAHPVPVGKYMIRSRFIHWGTYDFGLCLNNEHKFYLKKTIDNFNNKNEFLK